MATKNKIKKHKVYLCGTDARYHIPDDAGGIRVFFDEKSMKERVKCWRECGIVELVLDCSKPKVIVEEDWELAKKNAKSSTQIAIESITHAPGNIFKCIRYEVRNVWWGVKELVSTRYYRLIYRFKKDK